MGWYNASWTKRVKVTVLASKVDADLTGYPVYVNLANLPVGFHTNVNQTDARDIRVTTSDGTTEVPREVVWYSSASDAGEMYFKGDVDGDTDTDFYIYYGNASATEPAVNATYGRNNTWTSYKGVWHLQNQGNGTTGEYVDSTGNGTNGTGATAPTQTAFGIANGVDFTPKNDKLIDFGTPSVFNSFTALTTEFWVRLHDHSQNHCFFRNLGTDGINNMIVNTGVYVFSVTKGAATREVRTNVAMSDEVTYHVSNAWRASDQSAIIYFDGAVRASSIQVSGSPADSGTSPNKLLFGGYAAPSATKYGYHKEDEVRISNDYKSAEWVSTNYNNQSSPSTFYSLGTEEQFIISPFPSFKHS